MKKIYIIAHLLLYAVFTKAQTNTLPANGNVGIGTTSPTSPLTVMGDIHSTGRIGGNGMFKNVLKITPLYYSPAYIYINTNIPTTDSSSPQIHITGYMYGGTVKKALKITIGWYYYQGNFLWSQWQSDFGYHRPSRVRLGTYLKNGSSFIRIEIANDGAYYANYSVSATDGGEYASAFYTGWTYNEGEMPAAETNQIHTVSLESDLLVDGKVGIGTINPSSKLTVNGDILADGIKNTNAYAEKILNIPSFPNQVSNLAVDLILGNLLISGYIQVEITSFYNYAPAIGKLTKIFAVGTNPGGHIYTNESRVSDAMGTVTNEIAIGDFVWDAQNSTFKIPISHITNAENAFSVKVTIFSHFSSAGQISNSLAISPHYTMPALAKNQTYFNGNLGIGTSDTKGYKLAVAGNMIAESVKVKPQSIWPDYVFAKSYQLPTLQETEKHIKEKGHLPDIPSAAAVKANGIDLGEMNAKLLQKIEELTLHLIEKEKIVNDLLKRVETLEQK